MSKDTQLRILGVIRQIIATISPCEIHCKMVEDPEDPKCKYCMYREKVDLFNSRVEEITSIEEDLEG